MSTIQTAMLCKKCKEVLNNQDDIFGTSCGHLYHFLCLRECHGRSANCTDCDAYKPSMFKMFLDFGKTPLSIEDQSKMLELHNKLEEKQNTIASLEEKQKLLQINLQKLESKLKKLNDTLKSKDNIITDMEDRIATLEELNTFLTSENEKKKQTENDHMGSNNERTLNILKAELENEVEKYTKVSIENMKLRSMLHASNNADYLASISQNDTQMEENEIISDENSCSEAYNSTENISENNEQSDSQNCINHSVAIRNLNTKKLLRPLEKTVIMLASKMAISLKNEDIQNVLQINMKSKKVALIVNFKNDKFKHEFLTKKYLLKTHNDLRHLEIVENIDMDY